MKRTMIILALLMILSMFVTAEQFTTTVNVITGNNKTSIDTEHNDLNNLDCRQNQTIPLTIVLNRDTEDCESFDYELIQEYIETGIRSNNITYQGMNETKMTEILQNTVPEQFSDMQEWMTNTFMKKEDEFSTLRIEKDTGLYRNQVCLNRLNDTQSRMNFVNSTLTQRNNDLKETNNKLTFATITLTLCLLALIMRYIVNWRKMLDTRRMFK